MFQTDNFTEDDYISEQRRQYTRKNIDTCILRNPSVKCNALNFIKPFEETHLRLAPKPLQNLSSIYKKEFRGELDIQEESIPLKLICSSVENSEKLTIDRSKPGYTKYLDTSATSNRIDYLPYSSDQQRGIAAQDNITYWTWIKKETNVKYNVWPIKQNLSDKINTPKCFKRRNEFQILQNSVPNAGLTTETKSSFNKPDRSLNFKLLCICDEFNGSEVGTKKNTGH